LPTRLQLCAFIYRWLEHSVLSPLACPSARAKILVVGESEETISGGNMMRATLISMAALVAALMAVSAWGQEQIVTPIPAPTVVAAHPVAAAVVVQPNRWRYRWYGDRWWYWTPESRWMWYGDGGWTYYAPSPAPHVTYSPGYAYPDYYYNYPYGYYYPYGYGYYGPRVGVNVWGPRGAVRAGRWGVYW
jgi:hypothetical protein